ncbi:MAG: Gfo/Idh/MocA family oxidoreductase [Planctomycetes bacterium]|nr:Gfo/Idh/MocA family oxidoreductase [Planctomycetota bacterium]
MGKKGKVWRAGAIGHTGAGGFGHGLHLPYKDLPGVEMIAVADPDEAGRQKAMAQSGARRSYADYREMLAKEDLDVVSVGPRHTLAHAEMVEAAAQSGCHVYCEKPLARDLLDADRIVGACCRHGVRIAVSHQSRYVEPFLTARAMLQRGEIGRLLSIHGRGKEDHRGGGEDLLTLGTHVLDMMRYLAGDPEWVFGHVTLGGRDIRREDAAQPTEPVGPVAGDAVTAAYAFPNGVRGTFTSVRAQHLRGRRMGVSLVGTEATLILRYGKDATLQLSRTPIAPEEGGQFETLGIAQEPTVANSTPLGQTDMLFRGNRLAVWDLLQAAESGREPISSGKDARSALEMVLGVYASHLAGCRLRFPLEDRRHPLDPR